jgi:hypothetical protein
MEKTRTMVNEWPIQVVANGNEVRVYVEKRNRYDFHLMLHADNDQYLDRKEIHGKSFESPLKAIHFLKKWTKKKGYQGFKFMEEAAKDYEKKEVEITALLAEQATEEEKKRAKEIQQWRKYLIRRVFFCSYPCYALILVRVLKRAIETINGEHAYLQNMDHEKVSHYWAKMWKNILYLVKHDPEKYNPEFMKKLVKKARFFSSSHANQDSKWTEYDQFICDFLCESGILDGVKEILFKTDNKTFARHVEYVTRNLFYVEHVTRELVSMNEYSPLGKDEIFFNAICDGYEYELNKIKSYWHIIQCHFNSHYFVKYLEDFDALQEKIEDGDFTTLKQVNRMLKKNKDLRKFILTCYKKKEKDSNYDNEGRLALFVIFQCCSDLHMMTAPSHETKLEMTHVLNEEVMSLFASNSESIQAQSLGYKTWSACQDALLNPFG